MVEDPNIASVGALIGDPARAAMLNALLAGTPLTAGELAEVAGVSRPTASAHLGQLEAGGLLMHQKQGRHRYYSFASDEAARLLEALGVFAAGRVRPPRKRPGPRDPQLRHARVCYDHIAGDLGVALLDALVAAGSLNRADEAIILAEEGRARLVRFGIDIDALASRRRPLCLACLDWSVRRHHLAGALGAALLSAFTERGWLRRRPGSRSLIVSPKGRAALSAEFGLPAPA